MKLFIAEKPSVAKAIIAELGVKERKDGFVVTKNGDLVSWCFGHLMELAPPDKYLSDDVPKSKNGDKVWREQDLPILPQKWLNGVKSDCKKQFKLLGSLLKKCTAVVNCGDPDREGQLLVDEVLEHYGNKKPVYRYWVSAQDSASVRKGLAHLQPNAKFKGMLLAAKGRQRADWLLGMNLTRAYTLAAKRSGGKVLLSVGRVQTPTLNLVAQRDAAIKNFKPVSYFTLKGIFGSDRQFTSTFKPQGKLKGLDAENRLVDLQVAKAILTKLNVCKTAKVLKVENKKRVLVHPKAFSLADMQQYASTKWGFSAQKTLDICQALYEKHKLTSYPRSDCQYLPEVQHAEAPKVMAALKAVNPALTKLIDAADLSIKSKTWNDKKITAHHGLIPTQQRGELSALSADEIKVYDAIVKRYIAQFYPPCIMGSSLVSVDAAGFNFTAAGSVVINAGFKIVAGSDDDLEEDKNKAAEKEQKIPNLQEGEVIPVVKFTVTQDKTKAPPAFTEGTLIKAMENIHTVVDDPVFKKYLKDGDGIGTSATRAAIIDELKKKDFLAVSGKKLTATNLGLRLLSVLPDVVKNPVLTALFESKLKEVEAGKMSLEAFEQEQRAFVSKCVAEAAQKNIHITIEKQ